MSSILFQSADAEVTLIDVPTSIADAQCYRSDSIHHLLSCSPLKKPFVSHEPKTARAQERLQSQVGHGHNLDLSFKTFLERGLCCIRENRIGDWCLPRFVVCTDQAPTASKRKAANDSEDDHASPHSAKLNTSKLWQDVSYMPSQTAYPKDCQAKFLLDEPGDSNQRIVVTDAAGLWASNPYDRSYDLLIGPDSQTSKFRIPARSSFFLGDCSKSRVFHSAVRQVAEQQGTARLFDMILMDPPWPNRSVKRGHQKGKGHYSVSDSLWDLRQLVFEMDVNVLLADQGFVGIWITNSPAVRDLVLSEDGFFESWGIVLEEEWIWIKTTKSGEPMMNLDSLWRKPYEILLVGRKDSHRSLREEKVDPGAAHVKRRLIAGVPDLHSRKPCLKDLLDPLLSRSGGDRVLEIFARNLVSGWWSWGNEAIKFNRETCWTSSLTQHNVGDGSRSMI